MSAESGKRNSVGASELGIVESLARFAILILLFAGLLSAGSPAAPPPTFLAFATPDVLAYNELVELSGTSHPAGSLQTRLQQLLTTPFISNEAYYAGARPLRPVNSRIGPILRAAMWNIAGGADFDLIRAVLADADEFRRSFETTPAHNRSATLPVADEQLRALQMADVIVLVEVDAGMSRSGYRDVPRELARALGMNYAYGVEFVWVDDQELRPAMQRPEQYRGLHGTAILSRYPIERATIRRLPDCYDWYSQEREPISALERARRWGGELAFRERVPREVRHGGRMAIIADLAVPEAPTGVATVVATHLENRCAPACRERQMAFLLESLKDAPNPLILAGDLNSTNSNVAATSIRKEISKRVISPSFWAPWMISWLTPLSAPRTMLFPPNYYRAYLDPTARHLAVLSPNPAAALFEAAREFRFADGGGFDFRGTSERTLDGRGKTLANSNARACKGFRPTFSMKRHFKGIVGRFKLDWFLVKPSDDFVFAPHFPMTLHELNWSMREGISDHSPITVDLPLGPAKSAL